MLNHLLYVLISVIILYPKPLVTISSYPIYPVYFLIAIILFLMPLVLFKKSYWQLPVTKSLWTLRIVFLFIFLISSFYLGLSFSRAVSFIGMILVTFFYELPFIFNIDINRFFKVFNKLFIFILIYSSLIIFYYLIKVRSLIYIINYVQEYLPIYPNYFAMLLVMHLCARFFLLKKRKIVVDLWILLLILITLSRTALLGLVIFFILYIMGNSNFSFRKKLAVVLIAVLLLTPVSYFVLISKGTSYGSTLQYTFLTRLFRWESALDVFYEHPLIGYGFDRTVNIIKYYHYFDEGRLVELGSTHNDYLDVLVKSGLIGLLAFLVFCMKVLNEGIRKNRLLFLIMTLLLIFALFQNPFKNSILMFYLYFITGGVLVKYNKQIILVDRLLDKKE